METGHGDALERASDEVLADRAADGDVRAFAVVVRRYERLLRAYAARVLGSTAHSDDVAQEALITAWQQLPALEDRAALRGWLIRITTRRAIDVLRADRPHDPLDDVEVAAPPAAEPQERAAAASLGAALSRSLEALPLQQRRVWAMRELGGYTYDEMARELGLPVSTVRGLLSRARGRLLKDMDGWR